MTELSFLVDLLLNHKLPKATRDAVASRILEVEQLLCPPGVAYAPMPSFVPDKLRPQGVPQAASTLAAMARHPDLFVGQVQAMPVAAPPEPVAVIAQTPAAVAAMNSRQQAIAESLAGKIDKQTGRPRKF